MTASMKRSRSPRRHPDPLALYFFSKDRDHQERVLAEIPFGGGAINDALVHFSNLELPFGGRGPSGVGSYHGRFGFERFSHRKSVIDGSTHLRSSAALSTVFGQAPLAAESFRGRIA